MDRKEEYLEKEGYINQEEPGNVKELGTDKESGGFESAVFFGEENAVLERNPRKDFSRVGLAYLAFLVASVLFQIVVRLILRGIGIAVSNGAATFIDVIAMYAVGAPICYLVFKKIPVQNHQVEKEKWGFGKILLYFMIAVGMMYIGNIVSQIVISIISSLTGIVMENPVESLVMNSSMLFKLMIIVVIGPIVEELLFRKILIDRIRIYGQGTAVFISALTFGLFHGNFYQVIYAFMLGLIFAYIYVKSNQIKYCIGFHIVINFMGSVLSLLIMNGIDLEMIESGDINVLMSMAPRLLLVMAYVFLVFGCMIASVVVIICLRKQITFDAGEIKILKGRWFKTVFLNVGMILFALGCGYLFYVNM